MVNMGQLGIRIPNVNTKQRTLVAPKNVQALPFKISVSVCDSPKRSVRKRTQSLGMSQTTCWRSLRQDLGLFPYRVQMSQVLSNVDKEKGKTMAKKFIGKSAASPNFLDLLRRAEVFLDDLSPPDYFLWGYLKYRVYKDKPQTIAELKDAIRREMAAISVETCRKVMATFLRRMELCLTQNGGHLEHML